MVPVCDTVAPALTIVAAMLSEARLRALLEPFDLHLASEQLGKVLTYLEVLLRWNRKINLTAIRSPEEAVTRHFGESMFLARCLELRGRLLDIGSGAGFPGLALKIPCPQLSLTLLEPRGKKRAFLKEVARLCDLEPIEVRPERLEKFATENPSARFETATARAVGSLDELVPQAVRCLMPGGKLCLWVSSRQAERIVQQDRLINWQAPVPVPLGTEREIWIGRRIY